jgi:osmotically-inducible protein OsmY
MAQRNHDEFYNTVHEALVDAGLHLDVDSAGQRVRLVGTVSSERERDAALEIASRVTGGADIVDEIEISTTAPNSAFDDSSTQQGFDFVETPEYAEDAASAEFDPDMMEDIGAGTSDPSESVEEAEPYFPPTDPVVRPDDSGQALEITGGFQDTAMDEVAEDPELDATEDEVDAPEGANIRDDETVQEDISRELSEDSATTDLEIAVEVRHGIVTLLGSVPSLEDALAAEEVARRVPGVRDVREETTIEQ